jgi:hypothetical protein
VAGPAADVWLNIQAKRAALLRQLGRSNEAETVEAELRQLLALADADHPVLAQLRGRPSSLTAAEATPRR